LAFDLNFLIESVLPSPMHFNPFPTKSLRSRKPFLIGLSLLFSLQVIVISYALEPDEKEDLGAGLFANCIQNLDEAAYDGRLSQDTNKPPSLREQEQFCQCHAQETVKAVSEWPASRLILEDKPSPEYLNAMLQTASFCRSQDAAPQ
jgi:hypothetical protein